MKTNTMTEKIEKLRIAAFFDANRTYPALFQHLGYRKRLAEQILHEIDEQKINELNELFDRVESEIKMIIGL